MADELITKQELIDAKPDVKNLGEAANGNETGIVTPRYGAPYSTAPAAIQKIQIDGANAIQAFQISGNNAIQSFQTNSGSALTTFQNNATAAITKVESTGGLISVPTLTALQAITSPYANQSAIVEATGAYYRWNAAATPPAWVATGRNFLTEAAADATTKANNAQSNAINAGKEYTDREINNLGITHSFLESISVAIVDEDDRRTWLEADGDGKPTQYATDCITESLGLSENIVSGPDIVCWGDSMTADVYPSSLGILLQNAGITSNVYNMGVGGETSVTICARQGGNPFLITSSTGVIPANKTPVRITLEPINGETVRPLLQGPSVWTGYLGDTHGTLSRVIPDDYYTFTRTTAGSEVTLNRPTAFYLDIAKPRLGDIHIIWIGQNGPNNPRAISDAKAMIQRMSALGKRFLVISKPTSTDADDAAWFAEFGRRFVAIRKYMVLYGLQDAAITPTTQDTTDIANGVVPTSLRKDSVHWTPTGYSILANVIFKRLKEMGWI